MKTLRTQDITSQSKENLRSERLVQSLPSDNIEAPVEQRKVVMQRNVERERAVLVRCVLVRFRVEIFVLVSADRRFRDQKSVMSRRLSLTARCRSSVVVCSSKLLPGNIGSGLSLSGFAVDTGTFARGRRRLVLFIRVWDRNRGNESIRAFRARLARPSCGRSEGATRELSNDFLGEISRRLASLGMITRRRPLKRNCC